MAAYRATIRRVAFNALIIVSALMWQQNVCAEAPELERIRSVFEPYAVQQIQQQKIPGLAVGIVLDKKVIYSRGFGVQELGESTPVSEHTLFHQASITKLFVATAIMQLAERGQVELDDLITKHLKYFKIRGALSEEIAIGHLMNHTSGMPDVFRYDWAHPMHGDDELERHVRMIGLRSLRSPPGEKFAYSNLGFEVLGDVIAKTSGKSFEAYVSEHIFDPLKMRHSTLAVGEADDQAVAAPHIKDSSGNVVVSEVYPYNRRHAPSSTLVSSVSDMTRWAIANLNHGTLDGNRILEETSYERMWRKSAEVSGPRSIGLGWFLNELDGRSLVFHGGSDLGFASMLILVPAEGMAVTLMANKNKASLRAIAEKAISVTLD